MKSIEFLKTMAVAEIVSLFQKNGIMRYRFVNKLESDDLCLDSKSLLSVVDSSVQLDGKNIENVFEPEQLEKLIAHLEKWLPTYKLKNDIYELLLSHPLRPRGGCFRFGKLPFQEFGFGYTMDQIKINGNVESRYNFTLQVFSPLFQNCYINIWDIRQEALLQDLMNEVKRRLAA